MSINAVAFFSFYISMSSFYFLISILAVILIYAEFKFMLSSFFYLTGLYILTSVYFVAENVRDFFYVLFLEQLGRNCIAAWRLGCLPLSDWFLLSWLDDWFHPAGAILLDYTFKTGAKGRVLFYAILSMVPVSFWGMLLPSAWFFFQFCLGCLLLFPSSCNQLD